MTAHELLGRLRAVLDILEALVAEVEADTQTPPVPSCPHPLVQREYAGEMGNVQGFHCRACGTTVADATPQGG